MLFVRFKSAHSLTRLAHDSQFIDQFCLDQNIFLDKTALSQEQMQANIVMMVQRSISVPGRVLMLLHPYDRPVVLQRAWCLYEIFTAMQSGASVDMCFSPDDEVLFLGALRGGQFNAKAVCSTVDAVQATATEAADKEMILSTIKTAVGLEQYNEQLRQFLVAQYSLAAMKVELSQSRGPPRTRT